MKFSSVRSVFHSLLSCLLGALVKISCTPCINSRMDWMAKYLLKTSWNSKRMHSRRPFSIYSPNETNIIYTCNLQTICFNTTFWQFVCTVDVRCECVLVSLLLVCVCAFRLVFPLFFLPLSLYPDTFILLCLFVVVPIRAALAFIPFGSKRKWM